MSSSDPKPEPFRSIEQVRDAHSELLGLLPEGALGDSDVRRIRAFLGQAAAAGAVLDTAADRKQAQGILDYWAATIYSQSHPSKDGGSANRLPVAETVLAEYQAHSMSEVAAAADRWYETVPDADKPLVRKVLLRLVRFDCAGHVFRPEAVTRSELEKLGSAQRLEPILAGLREANVLRIEPGEDPRQDRFGVRFDTVTRVWKPYAEALEQRHRFRNTVEYWVATHRDRSVLIRDQLLDDALDYHDRSDVEDEFIAASRGRERHQNIFNRNAKYGFAILSIGALLFAGFAVAQWARANREARQAREARDVARIKEVEANESKNLATKAAEKLEIKSNALRAKSDLTNIIALTRTLAEIGTVITDGQRQIAAKRLALLAETLKPRNLAGAEADGAKEAGPDEFQRLYEQIKPQLEPIRNGTASPEARAALAESALQLGRGFKNHAIEINDPSLVEEMTARRNAAYEMAQFTCRRIVDTFASKPSSDADAYVEEFWILYWGELAMLENARVETAMVEFGRILKRIDRSVADRLSSLGSKEASQDLKRFGRQQSRQALYALRTRSDLDEKLTREIQELSAWKVPAADQQALRESLDQQLIPAIKEGLREPISPGQDLPAAY